MSHTTTDDHSPTPAELTPNHHANHPGFSGLGGLLAGLSMIPRRRGVARLAADRAGVTSADRVVDVGSGPGAAAREAARRGAGVTGVEPASVMRRLARFLTRRSAGITWVDGVAEALPLADASATVLWSIATVHHWQDLDAGLTEAARVLAPGGRFLAVERQSHPGATGHASHGWTDAQATAFAERCSHAGFEDVVVEAVAAHRRRLWIVRGRRGVASIGS
jgi:ubiquinone/menaquinone biosynthesis C-methylase UbiE